jgi:hypothetical protein
MIIETIIATGSNFELEIATKMLMDISWVRSAIRKFTLDHMEPLDFSTSAHLFLSALPF